jgi:DNA-binding MarR family transcriptional regulator
MKSINKIGTLALGARMQKLSDTMRKDVTRIYKEHGIDFESRWFPVVYVLNINKSLSIVEIADELGYAHPSVITLVKELQSKKLIKSSSDRNDGRKRLISLTPKAKAMVKKMKPLWKKMIYLNDLLTNNKNNLIRAIEEVEAQLQKESFYDRMQKLLKNK